MSRKVYLHIGAPKTGTTYLQERLALNRRTLAQHGIHVPNRGPFAVPWLFHFRAALDLLGEDWGGEPGHAEGAWEALVKRVRRTSGTAVVSHEILAPAPPEAIARAKRELVGRSGDTELHVVYSARDLGRQVPAAWQESIKQGNRLSFRRYVRRVERGRAWFSRAFDLPAVLGAWSEGLPPERVHLVTVPQRDDPRVPADELWQRFCRAFEIDPAWAPLDSGSRNPSLGIPETQLLRQLNRRMDPKTRQLPSYDKLVRQLLAEGRLANRDSSAVRLPPGKLAWAEQEAERWISWLDGRAFDVIGDLDDLRPLPPVADRAWRNPDRVATKRQLGAALDALAAMTNEAARRPDPELQPAARARDALSKMRRP